MFANLAGMFAKLANIKIAQHSENKGKNVNWMFAIGKHGKKSWQTWQKNKQKRDVDDGKHTLWNNAKTSLVYTHHPCGLGWCVSPHGWAGQRNTIQAKTGDGVVLGGTPPPP